MMTNSLFPEKILIQNISSFYKKDIDVLMARLDQVHPVISGNKLFKLQPYLTEAVRHQKKGIVTFGGAWSNHIVATAAACSLQGLSSIGIIRGEQPANLSPTLRKAMDYGMQLHFVTRENYSKKEIPGFVDTHEYLRVEEGGYGVPGAQGIADIANYIPHADYYCCAVGTGTTLAGIINSLHPEQRAIGISIMKGNTSLADQIKKLLLHQHSNWTIFHDYHFGGYAKKTPELVAFMNTFYAHTNIPTDFIYTGKLCYAMGELIASDFFSKGSRIVIIHSGGLQGNSSLPNGTLIF